MLKRHRVFIAFFLFLSLYSGALYAFATTYVTPGTVLDPAGLPGAYTVGPLLSYGGAVTTGHDNEILYIDGSGDLASDSLFTRSSTGATNIEMTQGSDYAAFQLGSSISGFGIPGIGLFREDTNGTVGSGFIGILDADGLGATPYTIFLRVDDAATNQANQMVLLPQYGGFSISDGDGELSSVSIQQDGRATLGADNNDGGGDDSVGFIAELNGGLANQYLALRYADVDDQYIALWGQSGLSLDFNGGNQTAGEFYTFPTADGTNGQVLTTDGAGSLSWETPVGGSASLTSEYIGVGNGSNALSGSSSLTWNGDRLHVASTSSTNTLYIGEAVGNTNAVTATIGIGYTALQSISAGTLGNTGLGANALASVQSANGNTAIGYAAGDTLFGGDYNVYVGADADAVGGSPTASSNTVVGAKAKTYNTGSYNTLLGYDTGSNAYGSYNTIIGAQSGNDVGMNAYNVLIGYDVEMSTASLEGSVGIGKQAVISASNQFALADTITQMKLRGVDYTLPSTDGSSGYVLTTDGGGILTWEASGGGSAFTIDGDSNMFAGTSAGSSLAPGASDNFIAGVYAGANVDTGVENTLVGNNAGNALTTGSYNSFFGRNAGYKTTTGQSNIFFGYGSGFENTDGDGNVFLGLGAGQNWQAVDNQIAIGRQALAGSSTPGDNTGTDNIAIGYQAGYANTSGSNNYSIGWAAGNQTTTGGDNLFIGYSAGVSNTTGGYNVLLGHYNDTGATGVSNSIAVGYDNDLGGYSGSIILGSQATATSIRQFIAGSQAYPITDVYFGAGPLYNSAGTAPSTTIHGTGADGTSTNAGDLVLAGGSPFAGGTSLGGSLLFKTAQDFSSTILQTRMTIDRFGTVHIGETTTGGATPLLNVNTTDTDVTSDVRGVTIFSDYTNTTTDAINKIGLQIVTSGDFSGDGGSNSTVFGLYINTATGGDINYDIYAESGAYLSTSGTWTNASSRTLKENFVEASGSSVLDKLRNLSIYEWNYLTDSPSIVHIGPVAEDFKQIFGYGQDNKSISTIDPAGIALAAIKELDLRVRNLANLSSAPVSIADQLVSMAVRVKDLVVGSREYRTGITMYDEVTGDPYCLSIANGAPKTVSGECVGVIPEQPQNTTSQDSGDSTGDTLTGNSDQGSGGDESVTTEEDLPETQTNTSSDPSPSNTGDVQ